MTPLRCCNNARNLVNINQSLYFFVIVIYIGYVVIVSFNNSTELVTVSLRSGPLVLHWTLPWSRAECRVDPPFCMDSAQVFTFCCGVPWLLGLTPLVLTLILLSLTFVFARLTLNLTILAILLTLIRTILIFIFIFVALVFE